MDESDIPHSFGDAPTPLDSPILMGSRTQVIIRGDLAVAIRDGVRSAHRYQFRDLQHPGPHFQWNERQWSIFYDWAHDVDATFQSHAWVFVIDRIAEDPTSSMHGCRVFAAIGHPLDAPPA